MLKIIEELISTKMALKVQHNNCVDVLDPPLRTVLTS